MLFCLIQHHLFALSLLTTFDLKCQEDKLPHPAFRQGPESAAALSAGFREISGAAEGGARPRRTGRNRPLRPCPDRHGRQYRSGQAQRRRRRAAARLPCRRPRDRPQAGGGDRGRRHPGQRPHAAMDRGRRSPRRPAGGLMHPLRKSIRNFR